jgi:hypothetical protein
MGRQQEYQRPYISPQLLGAFIFLKFPYIDSTTLLQLALHLRLHIHRPQGQIIQRTPQLFTEHIGFLLRYLSSHKP